MEVLFCGTAAAEAWPALFCTCESCQKARAQGGKNIRSRAAYMLDDRIRIDFGPDTNLHHQKYGLAYERLDHLIMTHSHEDHLCPDDIMYRSKGFSVVGEKPLHVWGNERVEKRFARVTGGDWEKYHTVFHRIKPWEPMDLGHGVTATPVLAAHDTDEDCVNYRIQTGGKTALFAHDTGWYAEPTWEFLAGTPIDLLVLDATYCRNDNQSMHMGGMALARFRDELMRRGALARDARSVATHLSHNSAAGALHEDLERFFHPLGILVAYDGLTLTL